MKVPAIVLLVVWFASASVSGQTVAQALEVIDKGDFPAALGILRPLGRQLNPEAEDTLGVMYWDGRQGVEQNDSEAFNWFIRAGTHGSAQGQYRAGQMYFIGQGSPRTNAQRSKPLSISTLLGFFVLEPLSTPNRNVLSSAK